MRTPWLALAALLVACSAPPSVEDLPLADGQRVAVPVGILNQVTVQPPKGVRRVDGQTWAWTPAPDVAVVLRVQHNPEPDGGVMAFVDRQVDEINRGGNAGIERDERLQLGDLEARRIHAVELRQKPPTALWLVVAAAEDGMYVLSAAGPLDELRARAGAIDSFLTSARILAPPGSGRVGLRPATDGSGEEAESDPNGASAAAPAAEATAVVAPPPASGNP